jgi:hypothetical protein
LPGIYRNLKTGDFGVDFVKKMVDDRVMAAAYRPPARLGGVMAGNESLDLGSSTGLRVVLNAFRTGASCQEVSRKLEQALIGGFRRALKQFREKGVTLGELLKCRDNPQSLRELLRRLGGHD